MKLMILISFLSTLMYACGSVDLSFRAGNDSPAVFQSLTFTDKIALAEQSFQDHPVQYMAGAAQNKGIFLPDRPITLAYRKFSRADARGNILVAHGFSENMEKYREIVWDFYNAGFNVTVYEHRGHGRSSKFDDKFDGTHVDNFNKYVDDMKIMIDRTFSTALPTFIFAHSMGGGVTGRLIQKHPDIVDGVILSAPMMEFDTTGFPVWVVKALSTGASLFAANTYALGQGPAAPLESLKFEDNTGTSSRERWEAYNKHLAGLDKDLRLGGASWGWVKSAIFFTDTLKKSKELAKVKVPTLMFQAGDDQWVLPAGQNRYCGEIESCELVFIEEAKHEIYNEVDAIRDSYLTKIFHFIDDHS